MTPEFRASLALCLSLALGCHAEGSNQGPGPGGSSGSSSTLGGSGGMLSGGGSGGVLQAGTGGAGATDAGGMAGAGGSPSGGASGGSGPMTGGSAGAPAGGSPPLAGMGGSPGAGSGGTDAAGAGGSGGTFKVGSGKYPFPQNVFSERCTYPAMRDPMDAYRAYERWKEEIVTSEGAGGFRRTRRPDSPGAEVDSTVSEGIAYGMILAVMFGDQPLFDDLWQYSQLHVNDNGLMNWYISASGNVLDRGGATDSDEDIAWALVMADRQWGRSSALEEPYIELAKQQIERIWRHEVDHDRNYLLLPGDSWGATVLFNPSYFAPNQYRIFGEVTDNVEGWNRVIDTGYEMLEKCLSPALGNEENGLAPAWCTPEGNLSNNHPRNYQYDSARVPFRIGQDYCYNGEPRARAYLAKISRFFANIGAANIVDGYSLDGKPEPDPDSDPMGPQSAVFVGGAAVGAMHDPEFMALTQEGYSLVATGELLARSTYYNMSWTALSLLMLTGNLIEYPKP